MNSGHVPLAGIPRACSLCTYALAQYLASRFPRSLCLTILSSVPAWRAA